MTSLSLRDCKLHPGWIKPFLAAIGNGYNEKNSANMAGVSTSAIAKQVGRDPAFKDRYLEAHKNRKKRFGHGAW